jgi:RNase P/RNase MRP subunit p29
MENENIKNENVGRQVRLIVRQPNGVNSVWSGTLIREDALTYTIRTDRGERTEPKQMCAVEWLSPAKQQAAGGENHVG